MKLEAYGSETTTVPWTMEAKPERIIEQIPVRAAVRAQTTKWSIILCLCRYPNCLPRKPGGRTDHSAAGRMRAASASRSRRLSATSNTRSPPSRLRAITVAPAGRS